MNDSLETLPLRTTGTLADLVLALGAGSSCFCCGSPLCIPEAVFASGSPVPYGGRLLKCLRCGAEVSAQAVPEAPPGPFRDMLVRRQVLVAA